MEKLTLKDKLKVASGAALFIVGFVTADWLVYLVV